MHYFQGSREHRRPPPPLWASQLVTIDLPAKCHSNGIWLAANIGPRSHAGFANRFVLSLYKRQSILFLLADWFKTKRTDTKTTPFTSMQTPDPEKRY